MVDPPPQLHMLRALNRLPEVPSPPDGYAVRALHGDDCERWMSLMNANGELGAWTAERAERSFARGRIALEASVLVLWEERVVATAQLTLHADDDYAPMPELGWVAVDPAHRGRGLGGLVCAEVLARARAFVYRTIFLRTDDHRLPAIAIYLRLGFAPWHRDDPSAAHRWHAILRQIEARQ